MGLFGIFSIITAICLQYNIHCKGVKSESYSKLTAPPLRLDTGYGQGLKETGCSALVTMETVKGGGPMGPKFFSHVTYTSVMSPREETI